MQTDEQQIRQLVATWMAATKSGDIDTVLGLMADDVVFLVAGQPVMRKADFAAAARAQAAAGPKLEGESDIQEIEVAGDRAFMWTRLSVVVSPPGNAPPIRPAGYTLSVLRKEHGRWLPARDANLLAPVPAAPS